MATPRKTKDRSRGNPRSSPEVGAAEVESHHHHGCGVVMRKWGSLGRKSPPPRLRHGAEKVVETGGQPSLPPRRRSRPSQHEQHRRSPHRQQQLQVARRGAIEGASSTSHSRVLVLSIARLEEVVDPKQAAAHPRHHLLLATKNESKLRTPVASASLTARKQRQSASSPVRARHPAACPAPAARPMPTPAQPAPAAMSGYFYISYTCTTHIQKSNPGYEAQPCPAGCRGSLHPERTPLSELLPYTLRLDIAQPS